VAVTEGVGVVGVGWKEPPPLEPWSVAAVVLGVVDVDVGLSVPVVVVGLLAAREVVASYGEDTTRREIEVGIDEEYVPRYAEIEDE